MKFVRIIKKQDVMKLALKLISSAESNVIISMDMKEELKSPLPPEYHAKLNLLQKKGIKIKRYLFGPREIEHIIKNKYPSINSEYKGDLRKYIRFLIIDGEAGLFVLKRQIFYSEFQPLINSLLDYVKIL